MLVHLVSLENEKPMIVYKQIRKELEKYNKTIIEKDIFCLQQFISFSISIIINS